MKQAGFRSSLSSELSLTVLSNPGDRAGDGAPTNFFITGGTVALSK